MWPDGAVKKEIEKLIVLCENSDKGCEWKGLFKVFLVCAELAIRICSYFSYAKPINTYIAVKKP